MTASDPSQNDEARLLEKLRRIAALFEGATTDGERAAAELALERVRHRLDELRRTAPEQEQETSFSLSDPWSRQLLLALLRRYGIRPYRYRGQRRTTVVARVSKPFLDQTLWPQFQELQSTLVGHLNEVASRVISQVVHPDASEASEVEAPKRLTS